MPGPHLPVRSWLSHEEMAELDDAIKAFERATATEISPVMRLEAMDRVGRYLLALRERHHADRTASGADW